MAERRTTLEQFLLYLINNKGSDLHLAIGAKPRVRINGDLEDIEGTEVLVPPAVEKMVFALKEVDASRRTEVNSIGQLDFAYTFTYQGSNGVTKHTRFRVNVFRQKGDVGAVFRILNDKVVDPRKLGIPQSIIDLYTEKRGMVLIVGPTGSGKTTTLAGLIHLMNKSLPVNIITLEDPIEYYFDHDKALVNQRGLDVDCGSFADGLRAALREDPDIILVGEIRDKETAETALRAAETGHLLMSTLHTLGSVETINRLINIFPPEQAGMTRMQIADTLLAVVSQQLLPKADGSGRVAVFETLFASYDVKELIRDNQVARIKEFMLSEEGRAIGCSTMDTNIYTEYKKGTITKETAIAYALNRRAMRKLIEG